jgi:N-acetylmuramoyl-L-alanine amidase
MFAAPPCLRAALLLVAAAVPAVAQQPLFWRHDNLTPLGPRQPSAAAAVGQLCAGLSAADQQAGFRSHLPFGTRLLAARQQAGELWLTFDDGLLLAAPGCSLEHAIEQISKTALGDPALHTVHLFVQQPGGQLDDLGTLLGHQPARGPVPPPPPFTALTGVQGALTGKRIAISPGHGYYWHSSLGWTTQRGNIDGLTEDLHTAEICNQYLIPMLHDLGADVVLVREHGELPVDGLADNDQGAPRYTETGAWSLSASSGYNGGTYRFANVTASTTATATWTIPVAADGLYPVFVWFRAGSNRTAAATYTIEHSGGTSTATVDQTRDNLTWAHLGNYWFTAAGGARVTLANQASTGSVVIADTVRLGGGLGSIVRNGTTSNRRRWQEAARYWAQFAGAPSSVYDSIGTGQDSDDDVTTRPRFAEWRTADAFVSLHTNAGGGAGTETYIYNGGATAGSSSLRAAVHNQLIADLRGAYDPTWVDRGQKSANFGEVRLLSTMPGILVELAFHDTPNSVDHRALHDPDFRRLAARAMARGVLAHFAPTAPFPPEPPLALRVVQDGNRGLRVAWDPVAGASHYTVEVSPDGKGFVEVATVVGTQWSTGPLPHGTVRSFRVRAWNASGRSTPTEVLTAGTEHTGRAELLLVAGFDRFDRNVKAPDNTRDHLRLYGEALQQGASTSLGFDAASNEAVQFGRIALPAYRAVAWSLGEESTADETFSVLEQGLVGNYLTQGGALLVSGAEIGWDLDAQGTVADRTFYRTQLGASYLADDAGVYTLQGGLGGTLTAGLSPGAFASGTTQGLYDVDYPDALGVPDALSTICLRYGNGLIAGIQRVVPATGARVVNLGFPLETIVDPALRANLLQRIVAFLLPGRSLEGPATAPIGQRLDLQLAMPADAGLPYLFCTSDGLEPAIALPAGGLLPLRPGFLLSASLDPGNVFFGNFLGTLDAQGRANPFVQVPHLPWLVGSTFYFAGFTLDPLTGLDRTVTAWVRTTLTF